MARPIVAICIDGLDPEYLEACDAPNIREMAQRGFLRTGRGMMPSVTNVNNVSLVTAGYPEVHGISSNYWLDRDRGEEVYMESGEYILAETMFQRAEAQGKTSIMVTAKDKLRTLLSDRGDGSDEAGRAAVAVSSERPPDWVVEAVGPPPEIYSLEVNGWVINAASHIMARRPADLVYIATTDYAMHTYGPGHPMSQRHISILDDAIGSLVEAHADVTLFITADHGMSSKTRMIDLKGALGRYGIEANPVPIIKDRYVVHHSNLGGCMYVYLDSSGWESSQPGRPSRLGEALEILGGTPGVQEALPREEAASRFRLPYERIGDIVVTGEKDVVFGDPSEVDMPPNLRTHGSPHEVSIPLIGYNGDFSNFSFEENRDIGRYIFDKALS